MITALLEAEPLVPTFVYGLITLGALVGALCWVVGMGSGRPHSK